MTNMMPSPGNPKAGTFIEQQIQGLRAIGEDVNIVLVDRASQGPLQYLRTKRLVKEGVRSVRPEVVHIMYGGTLAMLAATVCRGVPTVVSFCGVDLLGAPYGSLAYRVRTWLGTLASKRAATLADAIVVKSRNLEQGLPPDIDRERVRIVPNGVSLERFRPLDRDRCRKELGWNPSVFHVLFSTADRRDAKKRLPLAEAAVDILNQRGVVAEIHGLSRVPHEMVPTWLNAADVVLLTSRADEGSPNIIKEALACDRPVVSVDVGDVKERIEGISGCHLAEPEPLDLAAKLQVVAGGPRRVEARARIEELSLERVAARLQEVYAMAADVHGRRATARRSAGRRSPRVGPRE